MSVMRQREKENCIGQWWDGEEEQKKLVKWCGGTGVCSEQSHVSVGDEGYNVQWLSSFACVCSFRC